MKQDYAVIFRHDLGHPIVQVFWGREIPPTKNDVPDHTRTFETGESIDVAERWIADWYMHAAVIKR